MPEQPLKNETRHSTEQGMVGWYGKLPGLGDFAGRRLPHALATGWDTWLRAGMDEIRTVYPEAWPDTFVAAPMWFFVAPAKAAGTAAIGAIAPSIDRVGRYYPLTIMATAPNANSALADDARLVNFFAGARAAIFDARRLVLAPEEFDERVAYLTPPFEMGSSKTREPSLIDEILSDLSESSCARQLADAKIQLPTDRLQHSLTMYPDLSLWWISPVEKASYQELTHRGALDRSLFSQLFSSHLRSEPTQVFTPL